jgi:hypothetical protein
MDRASSHYHPQASFSIETLRRASTRALYRLLELLPSAEVLNGRLVRVARPAGRGFVGRQERAWLQSARPRGDREGHHRVRAQAPLTPEGERHEAMQRAAGAVAPTCGEGHHWDPSRAGRVEMVPAQDDSATRRRSGGGSHRAPRAAGLSRELRPAACSWCQYKRVLCADGSLYWVVVLQPRNQRCAPPRYRKSPISAASCGGLHSTRVRSALRRRASFDSPPLAQCGCMHCVCLAPRACSTKAPRLGQSGTFRARSAHLRLLFNLHEGGLEDEVVIDVVSVGPDQGASR